MKEISPYKKPSQVRAYLALSFYAFKAMTRNKATFAFGFLFPVVFISIFGLIGNSSAKLPVGIRNDKTGIQDGFAKNFEGNPAIMIVRDSDEALNLKLKQGKIAGIASYEIISGNLESFAINLQTSSSNPQQAGTLKLIMQNAVDRKNLLFAKLETSTFQEHTSLNIIEVRGRQSRYIDFALPGQIGFSMLGTAIFGTVFGLIFLKKSLVLKRMFATPVQPLTILLSQGTSRLIMAMLQTSLILVLGVVVFHFYLPHGLLTFVELLLLSAIGLIAFLGFGFFMAGLANDENSANPLVNLVTLPQLLLSGTFFATDNLPHWIQPIANNLPLSYFNMAIRKITTEGGTLIDTLPYLAGLLLWGAVMYILAAKTFKWE